MHLLYVKEYMTFESGMIGIVGGIGAVGEDMVRCADQSYIVGFGNCGILCNIKTLRRLFTVAPHHPEIPGIPETNPDIPETKAF